MRTCFEELLEHMEKREAAMFEGDEFIEPEKCINATLIELTPDERQYILDNAIAAFAQDMLLGDKPSELVLRTFLMGVQLGKELERRQWEPAVDG